MKEPSLEDSPALWNRRAVDLESDEIVAQLLDRGTLADWRALYRLAKQDPSLRVRLKRIVLTVPLPLPHFWMAALRRLGEFIDFDAELPPYGESPV